MMTILKATPLKTDNASILQNVRKLENALQELSRHGIQVLETKVGKYGTPAIHVEYSLGCEVIRGQAARRQIVDSINGYLLVWVSVKECLVSWQEFPQPPHQRPARIPQEMH